MFLEMNLGLEKITSGQDFKKFREFVEGFLLIQHTIVLF